VITSGRNLAGHRLCTWVSFITAVPVLALLGSAVLLISAVFIAVVDMLPPLIALVCQTYVFYEA
jgi:ABC-type proline/glycine betaine transport system permease subunit